MKRLFDAGTWARLVMVSAALGVPGVPSAAEPRSVAPPRMLAQLDALVENTTSPELPGCTVGVLGSGIDVTRAYGIADLERRAPNTVDSVFNIASASKQFTAAAMLLLVGDGKLALDDDIRMYLPELSNLPQEITIDQLLHHTSGLRDYRFTDWVLGRDTLAQSNHDVLAFAARQRALNHAPGESHSYTNTGYVLLAIIVERVSGRSLADFSRERLFAPAGMTHTHWETDSQRVVANRSPGYAVAERSDAGKATRFVHMPTARNTYGSGNLLTTVGDMQRWHAALSRHAYGRTLTERLEEQGQLANGHVLTYARGLMVGRYRGLREVQHGGYNGNYTAWVARYPEIGLSVSMLCNSDHDDIHPHDLVDVFLPGGIPPRDAAPTDANRAQTDLSMHDGLYRRTDDGQLALLTFPKDARMDGRRYVRGPHSVEFDASRPGRISRRTYDNATEWVRLPAWTPTPGQLDEFQGRFTSDELLGSFDVTRPGEELRLTVRGLSHITATLQPRAADVFEAHGAPNLSGLLIAFKRDDRGRVMGLALAPDSLHELSFPKIAAH